MMKREDFDTAEEYVAYLESENAKLKAGNDLRLKISEKGALSIYGFGRFPFTMYKSQWFRLFANAQTIVDFLKAHDAELKDKGDVATEAKAA